MAAGDKYRTKASEFAAKVQQEPNPHLRAQFNHLARAYLRLAEQAELNSVPREIYYEALGPKTAS